MSAVKETIIRVTAAQAPWFPALSLPPAVAQDPGTVRLGSGCITGEFPAPPKR